MLMTLTVAVDGSALGNPGPSGWAWVISPQCWDAGGWDHGTNNLGELNAVRQILMATEEAGMRDEHLHLLADSQYAINVITKWMHSWKKRGWTKADKKPIANLELIQDIDRLMSGRNVTFEWVRGHTGHPLNELADTKAREAATLHQSGHTAPPGPGLTALSTPTTDQTSSYTSPASISVGQVRLAQKELVDAWLQDQPEKTHAWLSPDFIRIWPGGQATSDFCGPHPSSASMGRLHLQPAGTALIVSYTVTWAGGESTETAIWEPHPDGPRLVHHQSTIH